MSPCRRHRIRVRGHERHLDSGKRTHVRTHTREVEGERRGRKVYNKVEKFYKKKGYSHERAEHIAGAVAYGPQD